MHSYCCRALSLTSCISTTVVIASLIASPIVEAAGNRDGESAGVAGTAAACFFRYCWYFFRKLQLADAFRLPHRFASWLLPAASPSASSRLPPVPRSFASAIRWSQLCGLFFAQHPWLLRISLQNLLLRPLFLLLCTSSCLRLLLPDQVACMPVSLPQVLLWQAVNGCRSCSALSSFFSSSSSIFVAFLTSSCASCFHFLNFYHTSMQRRTSRPADACNLA